MARCSCFRDGDGYYIRLTGNLAVMGFLSKMVVWKRIRQRGFFVLLNCYILNSTTHPHARLVFYRAWDWHAYCWIYWSLLSQKLVSWYLSFRNCAPCVGFVKMFAAPISSVALCSTVISPLSHCSFVQKYLMLICLVLLLVLRPLSCSAMHDMLSW